MIKQVGDKMPSLALAEKIEGKRWHNGVLIQTVKWRDNLYQIKIGDQLVDFWGDNKNFLVTKYLDDQDSQGEIQ
jgi:hypothetical protein